MSQIDIRDTLAWKYWHVINEAKKINPEAIESVIYLGGEIVSTSFRVGNLKTDSLSEAARYAVAYLVVRKTAVSGPGRKTRDIPFPTFDGDFGKFFDEIFPGTRK
jgi:hypothetical protein